MSIPFGLGRISRTETPIHPGFWVLMVFFGVRVAILSTKKDSAADGKAGLEGNKRKMITFIGSAEEDVE